MALTTSVVRCCSYFNERNFRSVKSFGAEEGYMNAIGRNTRISSIVRSKLCKLCSQSNNEGAQKLLQEMNHYGTASVSDRAKLLNKISVCLGYKSVKDLLGNESSLAKSGVDLKDGVDDLGFLLTCERFACIKFGSASPIELYGEIKLGGNQLPAPSDGVFTSSVGGKLLDQEGQNQKQRLLGPPISDETLSSLEDETSDVFLSSLSAGQSLDVGRLNERLSLALPVSDNNFSLEEETTDVVPLSPPHQKTSIRKATAKESHINLVRESQQTKSLPDLFLDTPLSSIPRLGSRQCQQLEKIGFHTVRKLLNHFPRTYADLQNVQGEVDEGSYLISTGKVLSSRGIRASSFLSFLEVIVACEIRNDKVASEHGLDDDCSAATVRRKMVYLHLKKFFRGPRFTNKYFLEIIQSKHKEGDFVCVTGKVKLMPAKDHYELKEYNIDIIGNERESSVHGEGRPYPIYPSKVGLTAAFLRETISRALQSLSTDIDPLPKNICEEYALLDLHDAYMGIHCPKDSKEADLARKRLIFDDFFYLQLGRLFQMVEPLGSWIERDELLDSYKKHEPDAAVAQGWSSLTKKFVEALPYKLTPSQLNAASEIIRDLKRPVPMNRLVQGEVGCGKTVVAFLACMEVVSSGFQAALMVPTELLAIQHHEHLLKLLENVEDQSKPSVALLTGSTTARQSRIIRQGIQNGDISLVIGTHSLFADKVEFSALRVAIVDEQHRFGVIQRGTFTSKLFTGSGSLKMSAGSSDCLPKDEVYMAPHVLAMSATPIPRSLALALYGDMSLTQITDLPPGRIPVETFVLQGNSVCDDNVNQMIRDELEVGGKVFIVYPIIDTSEKLPQVRAAATDFDTVSCFFKGYDCGLLHGRMKGDEKEEALQKFRSGKIRILLSTQVIEIGVDVPDASMMVVMNSERFGFAQLHQLRGRVGRGSMKSKCIFLSSTASGINRLKTLAESSDGFHLANMDLALRGPGDLLGKKQSGHLPEFPIARLEVDGGILEDAHIAALKTLIASHDLEQFPKLKAELSMRQPLCILGD
ncbi:hypothetical protein MKW94_005952 [Papaver nudicaule]|uniref:DNA 3'-5' helicase n=1 Tax=Papaver nudicaule TaxID=74823 RepID=A0AA41VEG0_PAPNU|nr:hypothetical protein [Papaver nudicaule]